MMNQPTNDIVLPADLARAITNGNNAVVIAKVELNRLQELSQSELYTVDQLNKQKVELTEQVAVLSGSLDILEAQTEVALHTLSVAQESLTRSQNNKVAVEALLAQKATENAEMTVALGFRVNTVNALESSLFVAQEELRNESEKVEAKKKVLVEALQALSN